MIFWENYVVPSKEPIEYYEHRVVFVESDEQFNKYKYLSNYLEKKEVREVAD